MSLIQSRIQEVADLLLNPMTTRDSIQATLGKKWRAGKRTIDRYINRAKKININRVAKINEKVTEKIIENKVDVVKKTLMTLDEARQILEEKIKRLDSIKAGESFRLYDKKTGKEIGVMQATYSDELNAIKTQIAAMNQIGLWIGWNAPAKHEIKSDTPIHIGFKEKNEITDEL